MALSTSPPWPSSSLKFLSLPFASEEVCLRFREDTLLSRWFNTSCSLLLLIEIGEPQKLFFSSSWFSEIQSNFFLFLKSCDSRIWEIFKQFLGVFKVEAVQPILFVLCWYQSFVSSGNIINNSCNIQNNLNSVAIIKTKYIIKTISKFDNVTKSIHVIKTQFHEDGNLLRYR